MTDTPSTSGPVHLLKRLHKLETESANGVPGSDNLAESLRRHLQAKAVNNHKREEDRVKVLIGACVCYGLTIGKPVDCTTARALLDALDSFLVRQGERDAVLGPKPPLSGSEAFWRAIKGAP